MALLYPVLALASIVLFPALGLACVGDCDGNGKITRTETSLATKIVSGKAKLSQCPALDANGDGLATQDELTLAKANQSKGCPKPTATATRTKTASPSATATATVPTAGSVVVEFHNATLLPLTVLISGERSSGLDGDGSATYGPIALDVAQGVRQQTLELAPGRWLHRISVPQTGQAQAQQALVSAGARTDVDWTLFATVLRVNRATDDGDGSCDATCTLRDAVLTAQTTSPPTLITFDGAGNEVHVTQNAAVVVRGRDVQIDGRDARGNPSPLDPFEERTYPMTIRLEPPMLPASGALCPCSQSPGGSLRIAAPMVGLRGLAIDRTLPSEGQVCCGDLDVLAFDSGSAGSALHTVRLDGGAARLERAETPSGETGPATGKDCIDASSTGAAASSPIRVADSEVRFCFDRGVKSQAGHVRIERSWIHHNLRGGVFAQSPPTGSTVEGIAEVVDSLVEANGSNCPSGDPHACGSDQVVARAGASEIAAQGLLSRVNASGTIARDGALQGFYFDGGATGRLEGNYVCGIRGASGAKGLLVQKSSGTADDVVVRGSTFAYNEDAGAKVRGSFAADFGTATDPGQNAFTENGGATRLNLVNAMTAPIPVVSARGNQWQHCHAATSTATSCDEQSIANQDTNNNVATIDRVNVAGAQSQQAATGLELHSAAPTLASTGEMVRIRGRGFDAISGHEGGAGGDCHTLAATNTCAPLRGTCVEFLEGDAWVPAAEVVGVTPTVLTVRAPFACTAPSSIRVRRRVGGGVALSAEIPFCTP